MGGEDFQLDADAEMGAGDTLIVSKKNSEENLNGSHLDRRFSATSSSGSIDSTTESVSSLRSLPDMGTPGTGQTYAPESFATRSSEHKRRRSLTEPSIGSGKKAGKKEKRRSVFQPNVRDEVLHKKSTPELEQVNPASPSLLHVPIPILGTEGHYISSDGRNLLHDALTSSYAGITELGLQSNYAEHSDLGNPMERIPSEASLSGKSSPQHSIDGGQNLAGLAAAHSSNSDLLAAGMSASEIDDRPIGPMPGTGGTGACNDGVVGVESVGLELSFDGVDASGDAVIEAALSDVRNVSEGSDKKEQV